jgi:deoxyribodipyrimidine photolyase-related protein
MSDGNLIVILGDQLSMAISSLKDFRLDTDQILMMEVMAEGQYVPHHKHKLVFIFSAMRHFSEELAEKGYRVNYISLDSTDSRGNFAKTLNAFIQKKNFKKVIVTEPSEYRVLQDIKNNWTQYLPIDIREDCRFFCSIDEFKKYAKNHSSLRMEYFYREMRKRTGLLMDGDKPHGGRWNYDKFNRNAYDFKTPFPTAMTNANSPLTLKVIDMVNQLFPDNIGKTTTFHWAVTRNQALKQLNFFIDNCLPFFGEFQDAMLSSDHRLFHSMLSAYINVGLLLPKEVVTRAIEAYETKSEISIESVEGFVRQILGWREYVRGIYWLKMPNYKNSNELSANKPLPDFYWNAQTDMACMKSVIQQTIDFSYSHHIQRLMITGNFALLAGLNVGEVCDWYLAVYLDAFEWVELPNTLGMACYADQGLMASKPYAASGNYINKMSNFCGGCSYDVKKKTGENACPFNSLYWWFLIKNESKLSPNPRLKFPYANLKKMPQGMKAELVAQAKDFLKKLYP